jgi:hypothetical protein
MSNFESTLKQKKNSIKPNQTLINVKFNQT